MSYSSRSSSFSITARISAETDFQGHHFSGGLFYCPARGGKEAVMDEVTMTPEMTPQGDSLPPENIQVVSEEDAAKAVEGLED